MNVGIATHLYANHISLPVDNKLFHIRENTELAPFFFAVAANDSARRKGSNVPSGTENAAMTLGLSLGSILSVLARGLILYGNMAGFAAFNKILGIRQVAFIECYEQPSVWLIACERFCAEIIVSRLMHSIADS